MHERTWIAALTLIVALASTSRVLRGDQTPPAEPGLRWQFSAGG
jgi:hypothetical protein